MTRYIEEKKKEKEEKMKKEKKSTFTLGFSVTR